MRGFEPPTYRLGGGRSILLSYMGICAFSLPGYFIAESCACQPENPDRTMQTNQDAENAQSHSFVRFHESQHNTPERNSPSASVPVSSGDRCCVRKMTLLFCLLSVDGDPYFIVMPMISAQVRMLPFRSQQSLPLVPLLREFLQA